MTTFARVLVVEDDDAMASLIADEMAGAGYDAVAVGSAKDALAKASEARARGEPFDVVVTDVRLGADDGVALLAELRLQAQSANDVEPGVVVITAFGSLETAVRAFRSGAADFLPKPFEMASLRMSVQRVLERRRLKGEIRRLRREIGWRARRELVAVSPQMSSVLDFVARVADSDATVLVTGPSGTGKELIARALHERSSRSSGPFIAVNCAALPENLLETELFGHRKGAFTDARANRDGLFKAADGGTLLLDEIGEMPLPLQPKLLRVLQEREVMPVGATRAEAVDVRVVAATNRRLEDLVAAGRFREDLFYRVNVLQVELPPLAQRPEDILPMAEVFLERATRRGSARLGLTPAAAQALLGYRWPGNARELENVIERAAALCRGPSIDVADLPLAVSQPQPSELVDSAVQRKLTLEQLSNEYCVAVVQHLGGNQSAAARLLEIDRKTLARRLAAAGAKPSAMSEERPREA